MWKIIFRHQTSKGSSTTFSEWVLNALWLRRLNTFRASSLRNSKACTGIPFRLVPPPPSRSPLVAHFLGKREWDDKLIQVCEQNFLLLLRSDPETPRSCCTSYGMSWEETCCQKMEKRESFSTPRVSAQSKFATFSTSRIENRERARKKTFFFAPLFPSGYFMLYHFFPICLVTCISKTFFPPLKALSFSVRVRILSSTHFC